MSKKQFGSRLMALVLVVPIIMAMVGGCGSNQSTAPESVSASGAASTDASVAASATESAEGLYKLTQQDVLDIYGSDTSAAVYKDDSMKENVSGTDPKNLTLTDSDKQKIKAMNLKIATEVDHLDDATKWEIQGMQDVAKDLGITVKDNWVASAQNGISQLEDYQRIEAIAENYDAILTLPTDVATSSDILKKIMKKTKVGCDCAAPLGVDWTSSNFIGVSDADAYQAGVQSAEAAVKILNGKGTIGTIGYINGMKGAFRTCAERYRGWNSVFAKNPKVKVVQKWFDDPAQSKQIVAGLMSANPDIKVLVVDWANPPADNAQQVFKERGLKAWKDIALVAIDLDNTIVTPMAKDGPDNNYTAAFVSQTWYSVGCNLAKMYAKNILDGSKAPKFVASPPLPITTWNNLKTDYVKVAPKGWPIPQEVTNLQDQWPLGVEDKW